jgi:hemicentin
VPPQISLTVYNTIVVKLGSSFNLSVAVTGIPVPSVQWFRKEHQLMSSDRLIISMGGQVVHIKDATLNDSGVFTVTAIARGISASRHIQVIVYGALHFFVDRGLSVLKAVFLLVDPPTIHDIPENLTTIEGRNLTINCSASGHPNVTFRWLYKGRLIQNGQVLHLSEIKSSDQGNYSCVVSNLFGQAIQWTFVYVQGICRVCVS